MSSKLTVAPYGAWKSPISIDHVAGESLTFKEIHVNPKTEAIYLLESRPLEGGRTAIVEQQGSKSIDILPAQYSAQSKVHEYGGAAAAAGADGSLIFSDSKTNGVFRFKTGNEIEAVVDASKDLRYGDFDVHPVKTNLVLAIQEDHTSKNVENRLVLIDSTDKSVTIIIEGADFYIYPRFNHDGTKISWVQWNHPDMSWTGSELYVAEWNGENIGNVKLIAGKPRIESTSQPRWHEDGTLFFAADRTGFSQLYRLDVGSAEARQIVLDGFEDADIAMRKALMGVETYIILSPTQLVVSYTRLAKDGLLLVDIPTSTPVELPLELVQISGCAMRRVSSTKFVVLGSGLTTPSALYMVDINTHSKKTLLKSSNHIQFPSSTYSIAQHLTFPRTQGQDPKGISHAIFFPPHNPSFSPLPGTRPPVIVSIHGGPTNQGNLGINLQTQYWTSRGYAYVYVNYGGSTGYGREYRDELIDSWGVIDINDAASCLYYLATAGLVDKSKAGIEGGSAGGYTVLNSLVQYPNLWAAGNSLFGISDLMGFEATTHKYESHYLFNLIPDNGPEEREKVLRERSPYYHVNKITSPLLLLQGSEDKVVPLQQAVDMERIMKEKGKDVKITIFEGAGHGFGKAEHVKKTLEEEEALWKRTLL